MASTQYLDNSGLKHFWDGIKSHVSESISEGKSAAAEKLEGPKHSYTTAANAEKNWYRIANASTHQIDTTKPLRAQFRVVAYNTAAGVGYYEDWIVDIQVFGQNSSVRVFGGCAAPFSQVRVLYENTAASVTNATAPAIDLYLNYVLATASVVEIEEISNDGWTFLADGVLAASTVPSGYENRAQGPYGNGLAYCGTSDYANYSKLNYSNISANKTLAVGTTDGMKVLNCTGTITLTLPSPNANTAWFWIKNNGSGVVTLHPASTSVYFDNISEDLVLRPTEYIMIACQSNGHYSIVNDGRQKVALVGRNTEVGSATKHWFLVAETTVTSIYADPYIDMKVYIGAFGQLYGGILGGHARIGSTKGKTDSVALFWEYKTEGLNLGDFAITAQDTQGTSTKIQIWYHNPNGYATCKFIVLSEQLSSDSLGQPLWRLTRQRKTSADGDIESVESGFTKFAYSTLSTIVNPVTGNAATATKATQDGDGNVITQKYVTLDTAQTISGTKTFSNTISGSISGNAATATKATQDSNGRNISTGYMWRGSYERIQGTSTEHNDLNNYQTAGFYNVKTQYVDNCPNGIGIDAVLLVYPWNQGSYCTQELTESAASGNVRRWIRKLNSSTRSDWVQMASTNSDITGNAATATKATQDASGNVITSTYATKDEMSSQTHDGTEVTLTGYSKPSSTSAVAATDTVNAAIGKLEKALDGKANSSHNQASNTINAMTGYSKPSSTSAIAASDTLNAAIGKLEKALDGKQGTLTAVTSTELSTGTDTTTKAVTAKAVHDYVAGEVAGLVNSAPQALDTLSELATALGNDANFATTVSTNIGKKLDASSANYIKGLSISGRTITYTKGDDTTGTLTTQDTTYSNFVKSGSAAAAGLVPSPGTTAGTTKFLREDATWVVPTDNKVAQTVSTDNSELPLLAKDSNGTSTTTAGAKFAATVKLNPSTGTITATKFKGIIEGNADTSTKTKGVYLVIPNETTQTATLTASVTGITEYFPGLMVAYRAPFNTAASSTLNINSLGAKPIYYGVNTTSKDYYPANRLILLVYETTTTSTGCWKMVYSYDSNSNTYDRRLHNNAVKAAAAITSGTVIVGTSAGYKTAASGITFDITYPILYASEAIAANATNAKTYEAIPSVNLQTTKASWTGTQYSMAYLVGTISGTTVTIDSSIFTTTVPSTADGKVYIPIGILYSTYQIFFAPETDIYHYTNGAFQKYGATSVETGSTNGTIKINGTDIAVKGLGTAAYKADTYFAQASHNQASSTINAMTGYSKPSSTSAIATTDSLNAAVGKLEKALDGKAASATTLSGYGITDAKIASGTITLGSSTITPLTAASSLDASKLGDSGVTAQTWGNTSQQTPSHGGTFNIPYFTVNAKGIVTGAGTTTVKLPTDNNTDTLMTQAVSTAANRYPLLLCPTATATTDQGAKTGIFAKSVWINPSTNEVISGGANAFRMVNGNYGAFWRNDGSNTYLLVTASGDQYGSWTTARPITVANSTGICSINGTAASATKATQDASGNVITTTYATKSELPTAVTTSQIDTLFA